MPPKPHVFPQPRPPISSEEKPAAKTAQLPVLDEIIARFSDILRTDVGQMFSQVALCIQDWLKDLIPRLRDYEGARVPYFQSCFQTARTNIPWQMQQVLLDAGDTCGAHTRYAANEMRIVIERDMRMKRDMLWKNAIFQEQLERFVGEIYRNVLKFHDMTLSVIAEMLNNLEQQLQPILADADTRAMQATYMSRCRPSGPSRV